MQGLCQYRHALVEESHHSVGHMLGKRREPSSELTATYISCIFVIVYYRGSRLDVARVEGVLLDTL